MFYLHNSTNNALEFVMAIAIQIEYSPPSSTFKPSIKLSRIQIHFAFCNLYIISLLN